MTWRALKILMPGSYLQSCWFNWPRASLVAQMVKNLPAMQETWVWSLGQEDPLEEGMATHSSTLTWKILWTEEPGGLQSMGLQRVGHDWAAEHTHTSHFISSKTFIFIHFSISKLEMHLIMCNFFSFLVVHMIVVYIIIDTLDSMKYDICIQNIFQMNK